MGWDKELIRKENILAKRAQKGDTNAAFLLIDMFYERIFSYFGRLCPQMQDAEDLTQETFRKIWSSLDNYQVRDQFTAWIYKIAYHVYIDWIRKQKNTEALLPEKWWEMCDDHNSSFFKTISEREIAYKLYEAVDRLDGNKRQAIYLHYYQGLSLRETAVATNSAISTIKYRIREAVKNLRYEIDNSI